MNSPPDDPRPSSNESSCSGYKRKPQVYDKTCLICTAPTSCNNYGVTSCASCKAFFRRACLAGVDALKCLFFEDCPISLLTRNHCKKCRLLKCLSVGMNVSKIETGERKPKPRQRKKYKKRKSAQDYSATIDRVVAMPALAGSKQDPIAQSPPIAQPFSPSALLSAIQSQFGAVMSSEILSEMIKQLQEKIQAKSCECTCSCGKYKPGVPIVEQVKKE